MRYAAIRWTVRERCSIRCTASATPVTTSSATISHLCSSWSKVAIRGHDVTMIVLHRLAGLAAVKLASGQCGASGIAIDDANLYWTNTDAGTVMMVSKSGGKPATLASKQTEPAGIAVGGGVVYWTNHGTAPDFADGSVMRL